MAFEFYWDLGKAEANRQKHGVSFAEAATVFHDPLAITYSDGEHSKGEPRFLTFGMSSGQKMLVVSHCESRNSIRVISARPTTARERRIYEEGN